MLTFVSDPNEYTIYVASLFVVALVLPLALGFFAWGVIFKADPEAAQRNNADFVPAPNDPKMPPPTNSETDPQPAYDWSSGYFPEVQILTAQSRTDSRRNGREVGGEVPGEL